MVKLVLNVSVDQVLEVNLSQFKSKIVFVQEV